MELSVKLLLKWQLLFSPSRHGDSEVCEDHGKDSGKGGGRKVADSVNPKSNFPGANYFISGLHTGGQWILGLIPPLPSQRKRF